MILTVAQAITQLQTIDPEDTLYINWFGVEEFEGAGGSEISSSRWLDILHTADIEHFEDSIAENIQEEAWKK